MGKFGYFLHLFCTHFPQFAKTLTNNDEFAYLKSPFTKCKFYCILCKPKQGAALQILSMTLFEKVPLNQIFENFDYKICADLKEPLYNQLNLFNYPIDRTVMGKKATQQNLTSEEVESEKVERLDGIKVKMVKGGNDVTINGLALELLEKFLTAGREE